MRANSLSTTYGRVNTEINDYDPVKHARIPANNNVNNSNSSAFIRGNTLPISNVVSPVNQQREEPATFVTPQATVAYNGTPE